MRVDLSIPNLKDKKVVIVDDDDLTRGLLRSVLRAVGANVVAEASDGAQALTVIAKHKPQVVCLDIDMPEMDGLATLTKLRDSDSDVIVLMISAATTGDNVRQALGARADGFIAKPFTASKISQEIERALARRANVTK